MLQSAQQRAQQHAQQRAQQRWQQTGQQTGQPNGQPNGQQNWHIVTDFCKIIEKQSLLIHHLVEHDPVPQVVLQSAQSAQQRAQQSGQQTGQQTGQPNGQPNAGQQNWHIVIDFCKIIEKQSLRIRQLAENAIAETPSDGGDGSDEDFGTALDVEFAAATLVAAVMEAKTKKELDYEEAVRGAFPLVRVWT